MEPRLEASLSAPRCASDDGGDSSTWPDSIRRASTSGERPEEGLLTQPDSRHLVTQEEDEELFAMGAVLRTLAGCQDVLVQAKTQSLASAADAKDTSSRITWKEVEASCQKLDGTEIRISSMDLSCMLEEGGSSPGKPGPDSSVFYNIKFEVDPTKKQQQGSCSSKDSSGDCSLPAPVQAVLADAAATVAAPAGFEVAYSFADAARQVNRSGRPAARRSGVWEGPMMTLAGTPGPGQGHPASSLLSPGGSSSSGSASLRQLDDEPVRYMPVQQSATSAPPRCSSSSSSSDASWSQGLASAGSLSSKVLPFSAAGDILQAPLGEGIPAAQGGPSMTTSGALKPGGSRAATAEHPVRGSPFPEARSTQTTDPRQAADTCVWGDAPVRYGSLVLREAVPRKAEPTGMKKYLQAVKSKCGGLFVSKGQGRQANAC